MKAEPPKPAATEAFATLASAVTWKLGAPGASCDATCSAHGGSCAGNQEWLGWPESNDEVELVAGYAGLACSSKRSRCDMGECPLFFASSESPTSGSCFWCDIHGSDTHWATHMPTCGAQAGGRARLCPCDGVTPSPTQAPSVSAAWSLVGNGECDGTSFLSEAPSAGLEDCQTRCQADANCQSIAIGLQSSGGDYNLCQLLGGAATGHDNNGIYNCWSHQGQDDCVQVSGGDVAPTSGTYSSADGTYTNVAVTQGAVAPGPGTFCATEGTLAPTSSPTSSPMPAPMASPTASQNAAVFDILDMNDDGRITQAEFSTQLR